MEQREYQMMFQAEDTLWWYRGMEAITRRLVERYFPRGQGLSILDAGCGTGAAMGYLAEYGRVTGLDFSTHALEFCRRRRKTSLARGSVMQLPFRDCCFDLVTSFDVLCITGMDDVKALNEFRRVLAPGGRVILRLPACNWLRGTHDTAVDIGHRYAAGEIATKMGNAGFAVEHTSHANMWLFPLAVIKRWAERFLPRQTGSDLTLNMGPLNGLLRTILASEAGLVAGRGLNFGLTIVAVGRRE